MLNSDTLQRLTQSFAKTRVLVVGDLIADEFLTGQVGRISREAPVLILYHQHTDVVPGGAANAAANMASLGGQVEVIGLFGDDPSGVSLRQAFDERGIDATHVVIDPSRPTTTKTRISASSQQSVTQQIVRVDRESREPIDAAIEARVIEALEARIPYVDGVLVSEYGNGLFTPRVIARTLELCREHGKLVTVDAQCDLRLFNGVAALTPNQPEAEAVVGFTITDEASLRKAGQILLDETGAQHVLITRGANGIALFGADGSLHQIPAFNRHEVFDVTGAGDTVVGTLTLALAGGASPLEATILANLAASIVVRRFGTATTSVAELMDTWSKNPPEALVLG
ncbi:Bifunctional protein HldE [compost metagenome]